jgi:predicted nuclease of restriction endonuclease-like (RecB) superfamily
MLSEKIAAEKWGAKIIGQISEDLQKQLPGLRGFSQRNLVNMKHFYSEYQSFIFTQSSTAQLRSIRRETGNEIDITQFAPTEFMEQFFGISFTHHIFILNKCHSAKERIFYITQAATQFWSVSVLEHHINANLFSHQGKLPNNFSNTLSGELKPTALKVFQDDYLMDFISSNNTEDERIFEEKVVLDIKNFIMRMGTGFSFIGNQL